MFKNEFGLLNGHDWQLWSSIERLRFASSKLERHRSLLDHAGIANGTDHRSAISWRLLSEARAAYGGTPKVKEIGVSATLAVEDSMMNSPDASKIVRSYEGPNNEVIVTEKAFREALRYLVSIQPTDDERAMVPFERHSSLAINTLRRYAYDSLHSELEAMQAIYYQYSKDSTYFKENVPHGLVAAILCEAWEGVGSWRNQSGVLLLDECRS